MIRVLLGHLGYTPDEVEQMVEGDKKEWEIPLLGVSTRFLMQSLGTDWGRKMIRPDIWLRIVARRLHRLEREGRSVVVDDVRFPDEFDLIANGDGIMVKVVRPGAAPSGHESEGQLGWRKFDVVLHNDGTVPELRAKAAHLAP